MYRLMVQHKMFGPWKLLKVGLSFYSFEEAKTYLSDYAERLRLRAAWSDYFGEAHNLPLFVGVRHQGKIIYSENLFD